MFLSEAFGALVVDIYKFVEKWSSCMIELVVVLATKDDTYKQIMG